jgi:hypothetical protein
MIGQDRKEVYSNFSQFTLQPMESKSFLIYFTVISDIVEQDITLEALLDKVSQLLP